MEQTELSRSTLETLKAFLNILALAEPMMLHLWEADELTLNRLKCLRALQGGSKPAGTLARELGIAAASLTRVLERLESHRLIDRCIDPDDRRRVLVSITQGGRDLLGAPRFWQKSPFPDAFERLSEADRRALTHLLNTLAADIRSHTVDEAAMQGGSE